MADNIAITAGSGTTMATDDIGGVQYPRAKMTWGPDGTANDTDVASGKPMPVQVRHSNGTVMSDGTGLLISTTQLATLGQAAMAASQPVVIASNQSAIPITDNSGSLTVDNGGTFAVQATAVASEVHVGEVGGKSAYRVITMSTDTSAYASGDLIADTQQYDAFFRKADGTGVINTITVTEKDAQGAAFYIIFHRTSTSMGTENSAPNISDANLVAGIQHIVTVATTDFVTVSGTKIATLKNLGLPVMAVSGTDDLYVSILNSTGTPTYASGEIQLGIGVMLD